MRPEVLVEAPRGKRLETPPWARAVLGQVDPARSFAGAWLGERGNDVRRARVASPRLEAPSPQTREPSKPRGKKRVEAAKERATKKGLAKKGAAKKGLAKTSAAKKGARRVAVVPLGPVRVQGTLRFSRPRTRAKAGPKPPRVIRVPDTGAKITPRSTRRARAA